MKWLSCKEQTEQMGQMLMIPPPEVADHEFKTLVECFLQPL